MAVKITFLVSGAHNLNGIMAMKITLRISEAHNYPRNSCEKVHTDG